MAIYEVRPRSRGVIGWYGSAPPPDMVGAFQERNFRVQACSDEELANQAFLAGTAVVIFAQSPEKPMRSVSGLIKHAHALLNHGCNVAVRMLTSSRQQDGKVGRSDNLVADAIQRARLDKTVAGVHLFTATDRAKLKATPSSLPPSPRIHLFSADTSWAEVANGLDEPPGPPPNATLEITGDRVADLPDTYISLLQRAFYDCREVHLAPMEDEGKSGAQVFRAYPTLKDGTRGVWPQTYFVKLGRREKIFNEYINYKNIVDAYVPFYLGPRLIYDRCHLGACDGILVGDFVERAESLRESALRGRATHAISSLFTTTLNGWYRSAKEEGKPLSNYLSAPPSDSRTLLERARSAKEFGATQEPADLERLFASLPRLLPVLVGPGHGDLHASNVLVRGGDAILIDFGAHKPQMPLLRDLACLETSLFVDGFAEDRRNVKVCLESIEPLYSPALLQASFPITAPKDSSLWFYQCIAELRRYAREFERRPGQYAIVLATALLWKANRDPHLTGRAAELRAAGYLLAERLLLSSASRPTSRTTATHMGSDASTKR